MNNKPSNIMAFPATDTVSEMTRCEPLQQGMSLRDYFAAKAMQALITGNDVSEIEASKAAYRVADAMLRARER